MKALAVAAVFAVAIALVHAGETQAMEIKDMSPSKMNKDEKAGRHTAKATVKSIDAKTGTVTLDHEPVKSMNWPAMSMAFKVQDKALMDKLGQGKKVEVEFEQRGKDYVITSAK
jgi:Cu(I)/Ag(I) efflux system protein CusF